MDSSIIPGMEPPRKRPMVSVAAILQNGRFDHKYVLPDDTIASLCSNEITLNVKHFESALCMNCYINKVALPCLA